MNECLSYGEHIGEHSRDTLTASSQRRANLAGFDTISMSAYEGLAALGVSPQQMRALPGRVKCDPDPAAVLLCSSHVVVRRASA